MGDSDKLNATGPDSYRLIHHRHYLNGFLDALEIGDHVTFVIHDWGSALGFDWANRNRDRIAGIAYMEAIVRPVTWEEWPDEARPIFQAFRSPAGEEMVIEKNLFVEAVLPRSILRKLSDDEVAEYRRPFRDAEHRRPTLTWPREIPIEGEPADVSEIVANYANWLTVSDIPKLFIDADPGAILKGAQRDFCHNWPNQTEIKVVGSHFIQEDTPYENGEAITGRLPKRTIQSLR